MPSRPGSKCASCGATVPPWLETCQACGTAVSVPDGDSDPTWPEPVEQPSLGAGQKHDMARRDSFRRVARALEIAVQRRGPTLSITLELQQGRVPERELPMELGVTVVTPPAAFAGTPDATVRVERAAEAVICSVPARGMQPGEPLILALSFADTHEEIQTLISA